MIALPATGLRRSVSEHNSRLDIFCDWVEANVIFESEALSRTDITDLLVEEQIYADQDFAKFFVSSVWSELKRRSLNSGSGYPIAFVNSQLVPKGAWRDYPDFSFCIYLSYVINTGINRSGIDYTEQGSLFEELVKESVTYNFKGWKVLSTGWSRTARTKLKEVVDAVALELGEAVGFLKPWTSPSANDAGLDLLCYAPYADGRGGIPTYLLQCASGADWDTKLKTPDIELWNRIVQFTTRPSKGFAMPVALLDEDFKMNAFSVQGLFLDRTRLLAPSAVDANWLSASLAGKLVAWLEPHVRALPKHV